MSWVGIYLFSVQWINYSLLQWFDLKEFQFSYYSNIIFTTDNTSQLANLSFFSSFKIFLTNTWCYNHVSDLKKVIIHYQRLSSHLTRHLTHFFTLFQLWHDTWNYNAMTFCLHKNNKFKSFEPTLISFCHFHWISQRLNTKIEACFHLLILKRM